MVFAILAVNSLETSLLLDDAVGVIAMTIAFSVVLHGVTAGIPGRRYAELVSVEPVAGIAPWARPTSFARPAGSGGGHVSGPEDGATDGG